MARIKAPLYAIALYLRLGSRGPAPTTLPLPMTRTIQLFDSTVQSIMGGARTVKAIASLKWAQLTRARAPQPRSGRATAKSRSHTATRAARNIDRDGMSSTGKQQCVIIASCKPFEVESVLLSGKPLHAARPSFVVDMFVLFCCVVDNI